jgi:hypothetical protein
MATLAGRPTSAYRPRSRAPAAPAHWRQDQQWHERPAVVQFIYLSMLLHAIAILLFGAPPGGSRDGRAMWGALNVQLVAPKPDIVLPPRLEPIAPLPLPRLERELRIPPTAPPRRAAPAPETKAPVPILEPVIVPRAMERIAPPELKLEKALPTPKIEVVPVPAAPPVPVPAQVKPITPDLPRVERTMVEPPRIEAPIAQPIAPVAPPVKERPVPPPEIPRIDTPVMPTLPSAPALPTVERAPEITAPAIPATPAAPEVAQKVEPKVEPRVEPRMEPRPAIIPREEFPRAPVRPAPPAPTPTAPSSDFDPTKPSVDLDAVRRRAGQLAREGSGQRALLPFPMPAPPERKTKTEEALEKARKPDCRTAYKDLGLLAAVPLIANEFGEGTCRW